MSTQFPIPQQAPPNDPADAAAVLDHLASGRPLDPSVVERVRARAAEVTEGIRRDRGLVDDETFQSLLDDEA